MKEGGGECTTATARSAVAAPLIFFSRDEAANNGSHDGRLMPPPPRGFGWHLFFRATAWSVPSPPPVAAACEGAKTAWRAGGLEAAAVTGTTGGGA